jgi:hypothetical protein
MGIELIYPTITLFLSDLRSGLGESNGPGSEQWARSEYFFRKLLPVVDISPPELQEILNRPPTNELVELIDCQQGGFPGNHDGCHQPVQIDDTYCLISNYSGIKDGNNQRDYSARSLDELGKHWGLDQFLEIHERPATLGATWLYQSQLANSTDLPEVIAQAIYQNIIDYAIDSPVAGQQPMTGNPLMDWEKDLKGQGNWQGGHIYELWVDRATPAADLRTQIVQTPHILIWLMPASLKPENAYQMVSQSYQDLLYLCHYRHKILAAAYNSYDCTIKLKKDYSKITGYLKQIRQRAISDRQLQDILVSLTDFTYCLDLLKSQDRTIETNRDNYLCRLEDIQKKDDSTCNLKLFNHFIADDRYTPKYQKQIAADYEQLAPCQDILQILSQTVQGSIQIRQTQVDRTTNITIASIATGIATSQVLSAVITTYPKKRTELPTSKGFIEDTLQYTPILLTDPTLYVSLALSVFFGVVMFIALRWVPYWWDKLIPLKRR